MKTRFLLLLFFTTFCSRQYTPLFRTSSVQDSLEEFISCLDSIPNPYHAPTIVNVIISLGPDNDTIISFVAHYGLVYPVDNNLEMTSLVLGGGRINDKIAVVHIDKGIAFESFINTESLNLKEDEYDYFKHYSGPEYDVNTYPLSIRRYRFQEGVLIELERQKGLNEK